MTTMTTVRRRMGFLMGATIFAAGLATAAWAQSTPGPHQRCGPNEETRIETRNCPDMRPNYTRSRACCTRTTAKGTKTRCKSFPHCPKPTRS